MKESQQPKEFKDIPELLFRSRPAVRVINFITVYRIVTFPLLVILALVENMNAFKWLLLVSFFTDAIDGFLARRYNATSILGSKLDSIGDDLTIAAAMVGLLITRMQFVKEQAAVFAFLFLLFLLQVGMSFYRYQKISTFHTYLAKTAAVVAALFLLSVFFLKEISYPLFYTAAAITATELLEEITLVFLLPEYQSNVKGLYWVLKKGRKKVAGNS
jgi:CDP-diacylglycerol--glycerol-3-phosphate 3-phosphatidyltransferase